MNLLQESLKVAGGLEEVFVVLLLDDTLRDKDAAQADEQDDTRAHPPIGPGDGTADHAPAQDHAINAETEIGRDGSGTIDGGLALILEMVVHLDAKDRVDDHFEQAESHGPHDDARRDLTTDGAPDGESCKTEGAHQVGEHVGLPAHRIAVQLVGLEKGIVLIVEAAGKNPLFHDMDGNQRGNGRQDLEFRAPVIPENEDDRRKSKTIS